VVVVVVVKRTVVDPWQEWRSAARDIISGTVGGIAQVIAGHPLDTVKVRLQTQVVKAGEAPQFSGMMDCVRKTIKHEGFRGLYKGAASPLAGAMALNATIFFSYGRAQAVMSMGLKKGEQLTLNRTLAAGAIAGLVTSFVECPADVFKVKLQSQVGKGQFSGVFDCAKKIASQYGVRGVYQGLQATLARNIPAFGLYFYTYEGTNRFLSKPGQKEPSYFSCFIGGGVSGFGFWGLLYPLEIIKTRIQADALDKKDRVYRSYMDCWVKTIRDQGIRGLFRGYVPCVVRAVPVNATVFLTVTAIKRNLA